MPPRYDQLAVTALCSTTATPLTRRYYSMSFPGRWKARLRRLAQSETRRDVASIPIAPLNAAITALVPDCVVTLTYAGHGDDDEEWLLAYREIDPRAIFVLVTAWVRSRNVAPDLTAQALAEPDASPLRWNRVDVDLSV